MIIHCGLKQWQGWLKNNMRICKTVAISDISFIRQLFAWTAKHNTCCILNSNRDQQLFTDTYSTFDILIAVDSLAEIFPAPNQSSFDLLQNFHEEKKDWLFGFLTYDLKNEIEKLTSEN